MPREYAKGVIKVAFLPSLTAGCYYPNQTHLTHCGGERKGNELLIMFLKIFLTWKSSNRESFFFRRAMDGQYQLFVRM